MRYCRTGRMMVGVSLALVMLGVPSLVLAQECTGAKNPPNCLGTFLGVGVTPNSCFAHLETISYQITVINPASFCDEIHVNVQFWRPDNKPAPVDCNSPGGVTVATDMTLPPGQFIFITSPADPTPTPAGATRVLNAAMAYVVHHVDEDASKDVTAYACATACGLTSPTQLTSAFASTPNHIKHTCCRANGTCEELCAADCAAAGGTTSPHDDSVPTLCTGLQGCCLPNGTCITEDGLCCTASGGAVVPACGADDSAGCCVGTSCVSANSACCTLAAPVGKGGTPEPGHCTGPQGCCLPNGTCITMDPQCCDDQGGAVVPACGPDNSAGCCVGTSCVSANSACCILAAPAGKGGTTEPGHCTGPQGCCLPNGTCVTMDPQCCDDQGGVVVAACGGDAQGGCCVGTSCVPSDSACCALPAPNGKGGTVEPAHCTAPQGCCLPNGTCSTMDPQCCDDQGGVVVAACGGDPQAGCCVGSGCVSSDSACCALPAPNGKGGTVEPSPCGPPQGCCLPNGTCITMDPQCCDDQGGTVVPACGPDDSAGCCVGTGCVPANSACCTLAAPAGKGGTTEPAHCGITVACCLPDGSCQDMDKQCCDDITGAKVGADNTTCATSPCIVPEACSPGYWRGGNDVAKHVPAWCLTVPPAALPQPSCTPNHYIPRNGDCCAGSTATRFIDAFGITPAQWAAKTSRPVSTTMLQAMQQNGGCFNQILFLGTAALLDTASPNLGTPGYTPTSVIAKMQAYFAGTASCTDAQSYFSAIIAFEAIGGCDPLK